MTHEERLVPRLYLDVGGYRRWGDIVGVDRPRKRDRERHRESRGARGEENAMGSLILRGITVFHTIFL